jgi:glucokinase
VSQPARTLGVDIGGSKIIAAVVGPDGQAGPQVRVPTPADRGPEAVLDAAIGAARDAIGAAHDAARKAAGDRGGEPAGHRLVPGVAACGIGTAGTVDPGGVITYATDILPGWAGTDVREPFARTLGLRVTVLNDVHAAAEGERAHGAAADCATAVIVFVGTGIGGALVRDGKVLTGRTGSAGAVGHMPVPAGERRRCSCGGWNHLEAYASGPAITASYRESVGRAASGSPPGLPQIADLARVGDPAARAAIGQAAAALGCALGGLLNVLDPDVVVIGGGVAALADLLNAPIRQGLAEHALPGPARAELRFSRLGPLAAVIGAAVAARATEPVHPQPPPGGAIS